MTDGSKKSAICRLSYRGDCLMSGCCMILVIIMIISMAGETSFWVMCDNVPCGGTTANPRPEEIPCRYQEEGVRMLKNMWPAITVPTCSDAVSPSQDCITETCSVYKDTLLASKSVVQLELACLKQIQLSNGEWVSFGSICCSVCEKLVDYEEIFRTWTAVPPKQTCGIFTCTKGNAANKDICSNRSHHVKAAQAFSILTVLLLSFLAIFHALSVWQSLVMESESQGGRRRIPLPRQLLKIQKWVRIHVYFFHILASIFCFIGAVVMMAALARKLCDMRLAEYAKAGYGIRSFWFCMAVEVVFACNCFLQINTVKQAAEIKPVPAQEMPQLGRGREEGPRQVSPLPNPIESNLQMDDICSSVPREEEPAPVQLRAMSPADVSLDISEREVSSTSSTPKPSAVLP